MYINKAYIKGNYPRGMTKMKISFSDIEKPNQLK
jgi:hypothetical protein